MSHLGAINLSMDVSASSSQACRCIAVTEIVNGLGRPALHAKTLGFQHPSTGEDLFWDSELPADLRNAIVSLEALPPVDL